MISDTVAERITHWRKERGWNRERLAKECARLGHPEITHATLTNIESGRRHPDGTRRRAVTIDELMVIAYALDVPPILLIGKLESRGTPFLQDETVPTHMLIAWFSGEHPFPTGIPTEKTTESQALYQETLPPLKMLRDHQGLVDSHIRLSMALTETATEKEAFFATPETPHSQAKLSMILSTEDHFLREIYYAEKALVELRDKMRSIDLPPPVLPPIMGHLEEKSPDNYGEYAPFKSRGDTGIDMAGRWPDGTQWIAQIKSHKKGQG